MQSSLCSLLAGGILNTEVNCKILEVIFLISEITFNVSTAGQTAIIKTQLTCQQLPKVSPQRGGCCAKAAPSTLILIQALELLGRSQTSLVS